MSSAVETCQQLEAQNPTPIRPARCEDDASAWNYGESENLLPAVL